MRILILFLIIPTTAFSEYRAYQYLVKNDVPEKSSLTTSTLDPVSFAAYNGGLGLIQFETLRTWVCPGHTADLDICPSPYKKLLDDIL